MNILFLCLGQVNRSPTFERLAKLEVEAMDRTEQEQINIQSAGQYAGYPNLMNEELYLWADTIVVFTYDQLSFLKKYQDYKKKRILVVDLPDEYERFSPELMKEYAKWRMFAGKRLFKP